MFYKIISLKINYVLFLNLKVTKISSYPSHGNLITIKRYQESL